MCTMEASYDAINGEGPAQTKKIVFECKDKGHALAPDFPLPKEFFVFSGLHLTNFGPSHKNLRNVQGWAKVWFPGSVNMR